MWVACSDSDVRADVAVDLLVDVDPFVLDGMTKQPPARCPAFAQGLPPVGGPGFVDFDLVARHPEDEGLEASDDQTGREVDERFALQVGRQAGVLLSQLVLNCDGDPVSEEAVVGYGFGGHA